MSEEGMSSKRVARPPPHVQRKLPPKLFFPAADEIWQDTVKLQTNSLSARRHQQQNNASGSGSGGSFERYNYVKWKKGILSGAAANGREEEAALSSKQQQQQPTLHVADFQYDEDAEVDPTAIHVKRMVTDVLQAMSNKRGSASGSGVVVDGSPPSTSSPSFGSLSNYRDVKSRYMPATARPSTAPATKAQSKQQEKQGGAETKEQRQAMRCPSVPRYQRPKPRPYSARQFSDAVETERREAERQPFRATAGGIPGKYFSSLEVASTAKMQVLRDVAEDEVLYKKKKNAEVELLRKADVALAREKQRKEFHDRLLRNFEASLACGHPHAIEKARGIIQDTLTSTAASARDNDPKELTAFWVGADNKPTHQIKLEENPMFSLAASQLVRQVAQSLTTGTVEDGVRKYTVKSKHGQTLKPGFGSGSHSARTQFERDYAVYDPSQKRPENMRPLASAASRQRCDLRNLPTWRKVGLEYKVDDLNDRKWTAREINEVEGNLWDDE